MSIGIFYHHVTPSGFWWIGASWFFYHHVTPSGLGDWGGSFSGISKVGRWTEVDCNCCPDHYYLFPWHWIRHYHARGDRALPSPRAIYTSWRKLSRGYPFTSG